MVLRARSLALALACLSALLALSSALYTSSDDVVTLTAANFDKLVTNSDEPWIVEFFAPWCGHCVNLAPEYKKAATALKGVAKIGAVDVTANEALGSRFRVQGYPTIKVFGANKRSPSDYDGERTAKGIANAALKEARAIVSARLNGGSSSSSSSSSRSSGNSGSGSGSSGGSGGSGSVVDLTESTFASQVMNSDDYWIVSFTAPWCGHCQRLKPDFSRAASQLKGKASLGNVDCTVHQSLCQKYDVRGYPTIKVFGHGVAAKSKPAAYNGGRTASDIVTFVSNEVERSAPPPVPVQLTSQAEMDACSEKSLCVVAFLPHLADSRAEGRNGYIAALTTAAAKLKRHPVAWVWGQGNAQPKLEATLDIGGAGYPALAVVNAKKGKFAPMVGAFTAEGIVEFVEGLVSGRVPVYPVGKVPEIVKVPKWDGKDLPKSEL